MLYSPWGNYMPLADSQYGDAGAGAGSNSGPTQFSASGTGPSSAAGYFSPESINSYASAATGIFGAIFNRSGAPASVTTTGTASSTNWLLIGGIAVAALIAIKLMRRP